MTETAVKSWTTHVLACSTCDFTHPTYSKKKSLVVRIRLHAVDECEIKVIKETFKDLCQLNGGSMRIDKETFLQYLPLPGLLGGNRLET